MSQEGNYQEEPVQRIPEGQTSPVVYQGSNSFFAKIGIASFAAFVLAILFNFPLEKNILTVVEGQLAKNRACPLQYSGISLGYFLPKIIFDDVVVPGSCFKNPSASINLDSLVARISMPSFWPVGIKAKVTAMSDDLQLNIFPRLAIGGHAVQVEDTRIKGNFISKLLPMKVNINGNMDIQGHFEFKGQNIESGNFLLKSEDFSLPAQSIGGIPLPTLNFRKLELAGTQTKKKIHFKAIRLGSRNSPLIAEFKGSITLNAGNINYSTLDLEGKVKFSDELLNEISLIRLLLNGKKQKDGFYFLQLTGSLMRPIHRFVDPS